MTFPIYTLAFRLDGRSWQRLGALISLASMKPVWLRHFVAHGNRIPVMAFTADGKWLASVRADGGIRRWH